MDEQNERLHTDFQLNIIQNTVLDFLSKMQNRIEDKYVDGFSGWDLNTEQNKRKLRSKLMAKVISIFKAGEINNFTYVDIANFAMFLDNLENNKKK